MTKPVTVGADDVEVAVCVAVVDVELFVETVDEEELAAPGRHSSRVSYVWSKSKEVMITLTGVVVVQLSADGTRDASGCTSPTYALTKDISIKH